LPPGSGPADHHAGRRRRPCHEEVGPRSRHGRLHAAKRPEGYIVRIEPEGGEAVGKWSGSGNIDAKDQIAFSDVPPARYVLHGQPNPSSAGQETAPVTIDLREAKRPRSPSGQVIL